MSTETLHRNLLALSESVELLLERRLILPALCLIYTGIDIVAGLDRQVGEGTRSSFSRWCENYLLKAVPLPCSGLDLYAARCGVLHSASADADLVRKGKAKRIIYAWGRGDANDLQEVTRRMNRDEIAIQLESLLAGFLSGTVEYLREMHADPAREAIALTASGLWFTNVGMADVRKFLAAMNSSELGSS